MFYSSTTVALCDLSRGASLIVEVACEGLVGSSPEGPAQVVDQALGGSDDQDVHQVVDLVGGQFEQFVAVVVVRRRRGVVGDEDGEDG